MVDLKQIIENPVVYSIPGMEKAVVDRDNTYKEVDGEQLMVDIYRSPDAGDQMLPAVIFVHGDGVPERLRGARQWGQYVSWGQLAAASGLVGVVFNHRSSMGHTRMQDPDKDVHDLIDHIRNNAERYGIDPSRLAVWTCSAGGPFGVRVVTRGQHDYIRCTVAYYALMDLLHLKETIPPLLDDQTIRDYSATYCLDEVPQTIAPILIAKAGQDAPHFNQAIDRFVAKAEANGVPVEMLLHPTGQHGFDIFDNDETSHNIIKRTLEFLTRHLIA
jgi:acetyl esterase/lipase